VVEARVQELMKPELARFMRDEIDAEELTQLKKGTRERATAEDAMLRGLDTTGRMPSTSSTSKNQASTAQ